MVTTSYEVLRPFSGGPNGDYQPGDIIAASAIRPTAARVLVEQRRLRAIQMGGSRASEERAEWLTALEGYAAFEAPESAPAGSQMARLAAEALDAEETATPLESRAVALRDQLTKAQGFVDGADERADFGTVAKALAEIAVVARVLDGVAVEARRARAIADEAARSRDAAWQKVDSAHTRLRGILGGTSNLDIDKDSTRWSICWRDLQDLLDVHEPDTKGARS